MMNYGFCEEGRLGCSYSRVEVTQGENELFHDVVAAATEELVPGAAQVRINDLSL